MLTMPVAAADSLMPVQAPAAAAGPGRRTRTADSMVPVQAPKAAAAMERRTGTSRQSSSSRPKRADKWVVVPKKKGNGEIRGFVIRCAYSGPCVLLGTEEELEEEEVGAP